MDYFRGGPLHGRWIEISPSLEELDVPVMKPRRATLKPIGSEQDEITTVTYRRDPTCGQRWKPVG